MLKMGINDCTNQEYHSDSQFLSSSNLKLILKDREKFYKEKILGERETSSKGHFEEGSLTHSLILEPHLVAQEYAFYNGMRKQGDDFKKFAEQNVGKPIISLPQRIRAESYVEAYKANKNAKSLLVGCVPEHTVCQTFLDVPIKVRCDAINLTENYIVDIKTSSFPVDVDSFKLTIDKWEYELSGALYASIVSQYYGRTFDFYFVAIDKQNLVCEAYKMSEKTRDRGLKKILDAVRIYKECIKTQNWSNEIKKLPIKLNDEILEV